MPLNIKDDSVHEQARKLAGLTGVSMTAAVRDAIDMRLAQIEHGQRQAASAKSGEKLLDLARICAEAVKGSGLSSDHSELYDDKGLPR